MTDPHSREKEEPWPDFAAQLRARREEVGLTQSDLGLLAGVHRGTIRNAEMGRPIEARTAANVKRAIGCAPGVNYRSRTDSRNNAESLRPVLSPTATRIITAAVLQAGEKDLPELATGYFDLVDALSRFPPDLPTSLQAFLEALQRLTPLAEIQHVEREIQHAVAARPTLYDVQDTLPLYPEPNQRDVPIKRRLPNDLVGAIVQSDLPDSTKQTILDVMMSRYEDLREQAVRQLNSEAHIVMALAFETLGNAAKIEQKQIGDPDVTRVADRVLAAIAKSVFGLADAPRA